MTTEPESPSSEGSAIWEAIHARLDGEQHRGVFVAPMTNLLDQLQGRVDDQTWALILDLEMRAGLEDMTGVQIGLELGTSVVGPQRWSKPSACRTTRPTS